MCLLIYDLHNSCIVSTVWSTETVCQKQSFQRIRISDSPQHDNNPTHSIKLSLFTQCSDFKIPSPTTGFDIDIKSVIPTQNHTPINIPSTVCNVLSVPFFLRQNNRHCEQDHVTLWTNAVTGPCQRPWAPRGGSGMATTPATSGSGDWGGRELARTACHLPQGAKSLGRKVHVMFRS